MSTKFLMSKTDFSICGWSGHIVKEMQTHVEVTEAQARWVSQNPTVNGPKFLLYLVGTFGMSDDLKDAGFMALMRNEQATQDAGGAPYVEPQLSIPTVEVAPKAGEPSAEDVLRKTLNDLPDKAAVLEYADKVLGKVMDVHHKAGKERVVEQVIEAMTQKA